MHECTAYIPDMSCQDSKRARYEARRREHPLLSPGALRARRSRTRRRAGLTVFHIEIDQRRITAFLRAAGRLADDASREQIEHALAQVLEDVTARWLGKKCRARDAQSPIADIMLAL
jgi:hypothetical protein